MVFEELWDGNAGVVRHCETARPFALNSRRRLGRHLVADV